MQVEFFSAGCRLCDAALDTLKGAFPDLDILEHRAQDCVDGSCCQLAEAYGVRAVPSLVVNGKVVLVGRPYDVDLIRLKPLLNPGRQPS
jgi:hypothetical protein